MAKRKCATPKCRGNALNGERWCFACRRVLLKAMRETGYLVDTTWIDNEDAKERSQAVERYIECNARDSGTKNHKERVRRIGASRQLSGAMLPSGKAKRKK